MNKSENTPDSVFKKIYDRYSQLVMRITLSILRDKEHAEDAYDYDATGWKSKTTTMDKIEACDIHVETLKNDNRIVTCDNEAKKY